MPERVENTPEDKDTVDFCRRLFRVSYQAAEEAFERCRVVQQAYSGYPNEETQITGSDIDFPVLFMLVEEILPNIWNRLFARRNFLRLKPKMRQMSFNQIQPLEDYWERMLLNDTLGLQYDGLMTVKDAIKFGKGYGIIDEEYLDIPTERLTLMADVSGAVQSVERSIYGARVKKRRYRYVPYQFVVPTIDGSTPEDVSAIFVLHEISDVQIRNMYKEDMAKKASDRCMLLDAETVIGKTKQGNLSTSYLRWWHFYQYFASIDDPGYRLQQMDVVRRQIADNSGPMPVVVPVIKCLFRDREIWIANGDQLIYDTQKQGREVRRDFVAASACPDSGSWFARSPVSRASDLNAGNNILWRSLLDIVAYHADPVKIINETMVPNAPDEIMPGTDLRVKGFNGDARSVLHFAQGPNIPPFVGDLGSKMMDDAARVSGKQMQLLGQGTAGVIRGGAGAFESYLQTAQARDKLMAKVIEQTWLLPVINLLMLRQQLETTENITYTAEDTRNRKWVTKTITLKDFLTAFEVFVDPGAKEDMSVQDRTMYLQEFLNVLRNNPAINQDAALERALGYDPSAKRLLNTPAERAQAMQALQQQLQAQQEQQSQGGVANQQVLGALGK